MWLHRKARVTVLSQKVIHFSERKIRCLTVTTTVVIWNIRFNVKAQYLGQIPIKMAHLTYSPSE